MFNRMATALRNKSRTGLGGALFLMALVLAYANHFHNSFHLSSQQNRNGNNLAGLCCYSLTDTKARARSIPAHA
jgi:hypothetical protein